MRKRTARFSLEPTQTSIEGLRTTLAYTTECTHAKTLMKEGWDLSPGDKIGYLIVTGTGKLYERAKPYILAAYSDIDIEYSVSNQVVPAASRVLSMFHITEDELVPSETTKTLMEFGRLTFDFLQSQQFRV